MRNIPPALQAHLNQDATTTTRLVKITATNGFTYGLAMLDQDVVYNDGAGDITYMATNGFDPTTIAGDLGFSVANSEGFSLISNAVEGIHVEDVERGLLDDAQWICYLVNFRDLSMGHVILDAGDLGEVRTRFGMIWIPEFVSYIMRLKQSVGATWSRTCRAVFGSPPNSPTGCGVDLTPLWVTGSVTSVGTESTRIFTGSDVNDSPALIPPGRLQFLTGNNAGRTFTVESVEGLVVALTETTPYDIEPADQYRIRPDCLKRYREDCITRWSNGPNFKGEPTIPVGDASGVQVPGAQTGRGSEWRGLANAIQDDD